jgi:hypothetical protein
MFSEVGLLNLYVVAREVQKDCDRVTEAKPHGDYELWTI